MRFDFILLLSFLVNAISERSIELKKEKLPQRNLQTLSELAEQFTPIFRMRNDMLCWPSEPLISEKGKCKQKNEFEKEKPFIYYDVYNMTGNGKESFMFTYWYYYSNQEGCGPLDPGHEKDTEGVHVFVVNGELKYVAFNQHNGRYVKKKHDVEILAGTQHPYVYVGKYSHGSYHNARSPCDNSKIWCEDPTGLFGCNTNCNYLSHNYCYYWKDPRADDYDWAPGILPLSSWVENDDYVELSNKKRSPQNFPVCTEEGGEINGLPYLEDVELNEYENTCKQNPFEWKNESDNLENIVWHGAHSTFEFPDQLPAHGGNGGSKFDDYDKLAELILAENEEFSVKEIGVRSGKRVDMVKFVLTTGNTLGPYGGDGGDYDNIVLGRNEYLRKVDYRFCKKDEINPFDTETTRVCWIKFTTSVGRTFTQGGSGGDEKTIEALPGRQLIGMHGQAGDEVDKLGFYSLPTNIEIPSALPQKLLPAHGGSGGSSFDDYNQLTEIILAGHEEFSVKEIGVRSGKRVDMVEFVLTTGNTLGPYGGDGGDYDNIVLGRNEYLRKVDYRFCKKDGGTTRVCWIKFTTSVGRTFTQGGSGGDEKTAVAPDGMQLVGMHGQAGNEVDKLGFIAYETSIVTPALPKKLPAHGGSGGSSFDDYNHMVKLIAFGNDRFSVQKINVRAGKRIDSVEMTLTTGDRLGPHGGSGGSPSTLTLSSNEYLKKVEYRFCNKNGTKRVCWIKFFTSKGRVLERGGSAGDQKTIAAPTGYQLVGMHGRKGNEVDYLGFYSYPLP